MHSRVSHCLLLLLAWAACVVTAQPRGQHGQRSQRSQHGQHGQHGQQARQQGRQPIRTLPAPRLPKGQTSALHIAAKTGNAANIRRALDRGAAINQIDWCKSQTAAVSCAQIVPMQQKYKRAGLAARVFVSVFVASQRRVVRIAGNAVPRTITVL